MLKHGRGLLLVRCRGMGLPDFDKMWAAYPTGSSDEVKRKIGGGVNGAWVTNTCVIRVSHCFDEADAPIPSNPPGLTTTFGANKKALRVPGDGVRAAP